MEITKRRKRPHHHDYLGRKKRRNEEYKDIEENIGHDIQPLHDIVAFDRRAWWTEEQCVCKLYIRK